MNPLFFGRAPRSLFGVYHPPRADRTRSSGVVLCYPFGQEYMRAHRAFRQLSFLLSNAGFHVLRFDYSGTGDSSGDALDSRLTDWVDDVRSAADELRESADLDTIAFVGLRLGGALAARAAEGRTDVSQVVLWDPAVRGTEYLHEITSTDRSPGAGRFATDGTVGVMGFPIAPLLQQDLTALDLCHVTAPAGSGRYIVFSEEREAYRSLAQIRLEDVRVRSELVPGNGDWNEVDDFGGALIPVALIRAIVSYLSEVVE